MENIRTLQDRQKGALEEFINNLNDKVDGMSEDEIKDYFDRNEYSDIITEVIDRWVPVYTQELRQLYCDDGFEISEALDDSSMDLSTDIDTNIKYGIYWAIYNYINEQFYAAAFLDDYLIKFEEETEE